MVILTLRGCPSHMIMKRCEKTQKHSFEYTSEKSFWRACQRNEEWREPIFQTAPEEPRRQVQKPWRRLGIVEGVAVEVNDKPSSHGVFWKSWEEPWRLATEVLGAWKGSMDPRRLLKIFGRVSRRLKLILPQRQWSAAVGENYWPGTDVSW